MKTPALTKASVLRLIKKGEKLPLATQNYPSRGQTAVQDLYQTSQGKIFLKRSSKRNHSECQINIEHGSLAEREYWAFCLASKIGLTVPLLWLIDQWTTLQLWLDYPDGRTFTTSQGKMDLEASNVFDCALFDWITGQIDRHDANYLYNYADRRIILIDSAHCFLKYSGSIPDYLKYFEIGFPNELRQKISTPTLNLINKLSLSDFGRLIPLREPNERKAAHDRLEEVKGIRCIQEVIDLYRRSRK